MTDAQIIASLTPRTTLPTVNAIICEFHCGYQKAKRCREVVMQARGVSGSGKKVWTMEDF